MNSGKGRLKRRTSPTRSLVGAAERAEGGLVGRVAATELEQAVSELAFPPVLAWDARGRVRLANAVAAETFGLALDEVVGMDLADLAEPAGEVQRTVEDIVSGHYVSVHTKRKVHVRGEADRTAYGASRAIEVDGIRGGVTVFIPETEVARLGRHPIQTQLDLVPVAVGFTDPDWIIETVSGEIRQLIDRSSHEVMGGSLLALVAPDDVDDVRGAEEDRDGPRSLPQVRFLLPAGDEVELCVVIAPRPTAGRRFALVGRIESYYPEQSDRVAELELRLRRIGAEVRAAGLIEVIGNPGLLDHPELSQLSARQWEILSRLVDGERVPTIANGLFISQSTVRNHLATIFQLFEVHSQAELLERLHQPVSS